MAVPRPHSADAVSLHVLHRAHQMTVPFENLSIHLSEPISLAEDDLIDKIVNRRRGGFCYQLNGAFAFLLQAMGAEVKRIAARVYGNGQTGPPFDHMALVVRASDASGPWLIDVGFGSHSVYPLLFDSRHEQDNPAGRFLLVDTEDGDVDVLKDGKPQYRIEPRERTLADFIPTCWWQRTSPDSHFTRSTICSRLTEDGRVSLSSRTLITTEPGCRTEQQLPDDDAVLAAYREHFGIVLDKVPRPPGDPAAPEVQGLPGAAVIPGAARGTPGSPPSRGGFRARRVASPPGLPPQAAPRPSGRSAPAGPTVPGGSSVPGGPAVPGGSSVPGGPGGLSVPGGSGLPRWRGRARGRPGPGRDPLAGPATPESAAGQWHARCAPGAPGQGANARPRYTQRRQRTSPVHAKTRTHSPRYTQRRQRTSPVHAKTPTHVPTYMQRHQRMSP